MSIEKSKSILFKFFPGWNGKIEENLDLVIRTRNIRVCTIIRKV